MIISSLLLIATFSVQAADVTITDIIEDVSSIDYTTQETTVVTSHPDIDVQNIDIVKATYTQQGTQATVTLQVRGSIEDRGKIIDLYNDAENPFQALNFVEYDFQVTTSEQDYTISYANQTGQVGGVETINLSSSDFTVVGDTLTIVFTLASATEVYENLSVTSMFVKMNLSEGDMDLTGFVYLSDIAPNPALEIMEAYAEDTVASVGDSIQFNGSIIPLTGQPPYQYHWDFGDQGTSNQLNPTHAYTKAGEFTYTFTVTDQADDTASQTGTITISSEGGSNGSGLSSQMIMFLAILAIVIVVGVVVIIWIIRR
jgi:hypothetical protein